MMYLLSIYRLQSLVTTSAVYEIGDLGLVPRSSSVIKAESCEIYTIGSNYIYKESLKSDSKKPSEVKLAIPPDTDSIISTVVGLEPSSTVKSSKTPISSSMLASEISRTSTKSPTKISLSKKDRIKEMPGDEEILRTFGSKIKDTSPEELMEQEENIRGQDNVDQTHQQVIKSDVQDAPEEPSETSLDDNEKFKEIVPIPTHDDREQKEPNEAEQGDSRK